MRGLFGVGVGLVGNGFGFGGLGLGRETDAPTAVDDVGDGAVVGDGDAVDAVEGFGRMLVAAEVADDAGGGADALAAAADDGCAALGHNDSDETLDFGIGEVGVGLANSVDGEIDAVDAAVLDDEREGFCGLLGGLLGLGLGLGLHWAFPFLC